MSFFKRLAQLLTGGASSGDDKGIYVYVQLKRSREIVQLRLNRSYELSRDDDGRLFSRKLITGSRTFEQAEGTFYFDDRYALIDADLVGAELSDREAYLAQQNAPTNPE